MLDISVLLQGQNFPFWRFIGREHDFEPQVLPGLGEDKRITMVVYEKPNGGIDGDIINIVRTNPGKNCRNAMHIAHSNR